MASKKGVAVTAALLGGILAASFAVWALPQGPGTAIEVSDFEGHIDGVQGIHRVLSEELDSSFRDLQEGRITAEQYRELAETTSSQINEQIVGLVGSGADEAWQASYAAYLEALRTQNTLVRETIAAAETAGERGAQESAQRIEDLQERIEALVAESERARP